jgi:hypothetical protein
MLSAIDIDLTLLINREGGGGRRRREKKSEESRRILNKLAWRSYENDIITMAGSRLLGGNSSLKNEISPAIKCAMVQ